MSLPREPGLQRRLAYGDIIRMRNRHTMNEYLDFVTHTHTHERSTRQSMLQNYEQLLDLPTVKVGTTIRDLLENTQLHICYKVMMCVICQEETVKMFDIVRKLGCEHIFHVRCIDKWLLENHKCPLCKKSVRI